MQELLARMWARIKNPVIRAFRTFVQTTLGVYLAGLTASPVLGDLVDLSLWNAAAAAGFVAVISLVMNLLEESRQATYNRG